MMPAHTSQNKSGKTNLTVAFVILALPLLGYLIFASDKILLLGGFSIKGIVSESRSA